KQDENAANAIVSYYAKGALVALALDLTLRERTRGEKSLDDVMRLLWERHGKPGIGVPVRGIQTLAEEVAGCELTDFFALALYSTDPLPVAELLEPLGVRYQQRAPSGHGDIGGKAAKEVLANLGVRVADRSE